MDREHQERAGTKATTHKPFSRSGNTAGLVVAMAGGKSSPSSMRTGPTGHDLMNQKH
jgi:hypothetical protein